MAENVLGDNYYTTMDREYQSQEEQMSVGVTVHEAAEGLFPQSVGSKIKMGADAVELQLTTEDVGKGWGAEAYGKEARQDIKDLTEYNEVKVHSIHMPVQIPNLSGLGREGFNEQQRDQIITEIRKHLDFAGDVSDGASVVIHTGEFPRPMAGKFKEFKAYPGEEYEAVVSLANKKTGDMALQIRSDQEITIPREIETESGIPRFEAVTVTVHDYMKEIREKGREQFLKDHNLWERRHEFEKADERDTAGMAIYFDYSNSKLSENTANARRWELSMREMLERADDTAEEMQRIKSSSMPEAEKNKALEKAERQRQRALDEAKAFKEYVKAYEPQIKKLQEDMKNTVPVKEVAIIRSADTLAQAGVVAMDTTREKKLRGPLYMTPENISPNEFGAHPDEMIEIVESARKRMVELLTKGELKDVKGRVIEKNPYFHKGMSKEEAEGYAEKHIKATLDTQHLNMWRRHFDRRAGETEEHRDKRFNKWYVDQVEKLADKGIIGNVHLVDGMGLGHTHLPAGQGTFPVAEAIEKLRAKGYTGSISSEGHGEGPERQLTSVWEAVGKPTGFYHAATQRSQSWTDVANSYFGSEKRPPGYIVGDYAKRISSDFTLWSGVALE